MAEEIDLSGLASTRRRPCEVLNIQAEHPRGIAARDLGKR